MQKWLPIARHNKHLLLEQSLPHIKLPQQAPGNGVIARI
jgi:hypothetical protein